MAEAGQECPPKLLTCPDGSKVAAGHECPPLMVPCPDGSEVQMGQKCPPTNLHFWQKPSFWLALVVLAAIAAAAGAAYRAWLTIHTRELLGLSPKLDFSKGKFGSSKMALDGPTIGLRARLGLRETRDG